MARKKKKWPTPQHKEVKANNAFTKIAPELKSLGWQLDDNLINIVDNNGQISMTTSPALRLVNDIFNFTLIPYKSGIEISRLEVFPEFQEQGYGRRFLDNLLFYLTNKGVSEIYAIPFPAGLDAHEGNPNIDVLSLQRFFKKSGFKPHLKDEYWEFDTNYLLKLSNPELDAALLNREFSIAKDQISSGDLNVFFNFLHHKEKNFMGTLHYISYSKIRRITRSFIDNKLVGHNQLKTLHCLIEETLAKSKANEFEPTLADKLKEHFARYLFDSVGDFTDKQRVIESTAALIGLLHLGDKGFENGIDTYTIMIDENDKHLRIDYAAKIDESDLRDIFLSKN